jgi:hypothetical protein
MFSIKNDLLFELLLIIYISFLYYSTRKEERSTVLYFAVILICFVILIKHNINKFILHKNTSNNTKYDILPETLQPPIYVGDDEHLELEQTQELELEYIPNQELNQTQDQGLEYIPNQELEQTQDQELEQTQEVHEQYRLPTNFTKNVEDISDSTFQTLTNPNAYRRSIREGGKGIYIRPNKIKNEGNTSHFWNDVISGIQTSKAKGFAF